jgi:transcriptional antiterminator NusG
VKVADPTVSQPFDEAPEQGQVADEVSLQPQDEGAGEPAETQDVLDAAVGTPDQSEAAADAAGTEAPEGPATVDEAFQGPGEDAQEGQTAEGAAADALQTGPGGEVADVDAPPVDPMEEFRESMRGKPGDWFVVHTYSGMENRVKANLENRITSLNMEDYIYEVIVPQEEVPEIKNGQRRMVRRTVLPGYVLVRMDLTDESWSTVRHTPSVTGFVGHSHQPVPLTFDEVEKMLAPAVQEQRPRPEPRSQERACSRPPAATAAPAGGCGRRSRSPTGCAGRLPRTRR